MSGSSGVHESIRSIPGAASEKASRGAVTSGVECTHEPTPTDGPMLRIGELADRAGVSVRSLRYYEEQGLLGATRTSSGQRRYGADSIDRVRWIQLLYAAGLTSRTVRQMLPCFDAGVLTDDMYANLLVERARVEQRLRELEDVRDRLDQVVAASARYMPNASGEASAAVA